MEYPLVLFFAFIAYGTYVAFWRLYLSPIAHIPGPRIAALTLWYEAYYDLILGGQYTFKIIELHKKYGPIIRISPWELHISDQDFLDMIYPGNSSRRRSNKYSFYTKFMGLDKSSFATVEHDLHRMRRAPLLPFFSIASVRRLQPVIQERVDVLLWRLKGYKDTGEVLNTSCMFAAMANDVVNLYSFARCEHRLEAPDFDPSSRDASLAGATAGNFIKHVPWVTDLMKALPDAISARLSPVYYTFIAQQRESMAQVMKIKKGENDQWKDREHPTIFHSVLDSNLPEEEKSVDRLSQDAQMLVMAGTTTTSGVLEVVAFWLLSQPDTLKKLKDELSAAIPNPNDVGTLPLPTLEALPYLTGVIKEGIRLSYGAACRLQRIDPDNAIVYKDMRTSKEYVIPAGTPVGASAVQIHHNEDIYPDSKKFRPERWLGEKGRQLERYLISFNMGHRKCFGIHLAYGELYLAVSALWRLWGSGGDGGIRGSDDLGVLTLFKTSLRDVEIESDYFAPMPQKGSQGIRVLVHG